MSKKSRKRRKEQRNAKKNGNRNGKTLVNELQPTVPRRSHTPWILAAAATLGILGTGIVHHFTTKSAHNVAHQRLQEAHRQHIASIVQSEAEEELQNYNATASFDALTLNHNYSVFDRFHQDVTRASDLQKKIKEHTQQLNHEKIDAVAYTDLTLASPMPNNQVFRTLERELNEELQRYALVIAPLQPRKHQVTLVYDNMDMEAAPSVTENGVQLYLVNSAIRYDVFTGLYDNAILRISQKRQDFGGVNVTVNSDGAKGKVIQRKIYISPRFSMSKRMRKSALLNTLLAEFTHSLFFTEKAGTLSKLTDGNSAAIRWSMEQTEEACIHAAVLNYLAQFDQHRPFAQYILSQYKNQERYAYVEQFFADTLHFSHNKRKFNVEGRIHALLGFYKEQRLEYFTKDGMHRFLNDFAEKRVK